MKYCAVGDPEMDRLVGEILESVAAAFERENPPAWEVCAVVLGGGYGRGEGGVFRAADGSRHLYNDLDLFVFSAGKASRNERCLRREWLDALGHELSGRFGVEVEFGPVTPVGVLHRLAPTLMYQELKRGWCPVWGNSEEVMARIPELPLSELPLSEGMRLLLNRGAGLLMAQQKLAAGGEDADFIVRNLYKAVLAAGDVFLMARREYRQSGRERLAELERCGAPAELIEFYRAALAFKYTPSAEIPEMLPELLDGAVGVWQRAYRDFMGFSPPMRSAGSVEFARDVVKNVLFFRSGGLTELGVSPRNRLVRTLPGLLMGQVPKEPFLRRRGLGREAFMECFFHLWRRFN